MPEAVRYLTADDLVVIAAAATNGAAQIRDYGLLDAAANRPRASAFGQDAYPTLHLKASALLHSILFNHALVDGNKRTGWLAVFVFYDLNGFALDVEDVEEAFDFVQRVIRDHLELEEMAGQLTKWVHPG